MVKGIKEDVEVATVECEEAHSLLVKEVNNSVRLELQCHDAKARTSLYNKLTDATEGRRLKIVFVLGTKANG